MICPAGGPHQMCVAEQSLCAALPIVVGVASLPMETLDISYNNISGRWFNMSALALHQLLLDGNSIQ